MRPLRLLLSLCTSLIAITLLLYISFGSRPEDTPRANPTAKKNRFSALLSFTSPSSLFPPSAIISLTDDNSTFFLARPAAFGPLLPSKGLSGPLWIGSGFGDDSMGRGELGCSDVPGWSDGDQPPVTGSSIALDPKRKILSSSNSDSADTDTASKTRSKRANSGGTSKSGDRTEDDDGTDDYLHHPLPPSEMPKGYTSKTSEHADIQSLQEGAEISGKVVLLKRGGCGFLEKVKWAQRRGGVALIVGDDVRGGPLIQMYAHGDTSNITIPALFTSHTTAHLLSSLLPSGGLLQDLSPEDAAKLGINKAGKGGKGGKAKDMSDKKHKDNSRPTNPKSSDIKKTPNSTPKSESAKTTDTSDEAGWFRSFFYALGFGNPGRNSRGDNRRPPSSGNIDWVLVEDWDDDSAQKPMKTKSATKQTGAKPTPTRAPDDFVIGEQDWRDPDLLPQKSSDTSQPKESPKVKQGSDSGSPKGGNVLPSSGEYDKDGHKVETKPEEESVEEETKGWLKTLLGDDNSQDETKAESTKRGDQSKSSFSEKLVLDRTNDKEKGNKPDPDQHDGLWVTLTPTNMSSSPFFDTLLVLVVSPLVTLTVVYALLLLRSRIRRRRWRAPKSVVERLPVRTYHTISDSSSPAATPVSSSPATPLLQHPPSRSASSLSVSRPRSRTTSEVPATSSSFQQGGRSPEEEKRESGLAEWRRRYGGRQKECVVCLEEYVDGVSRVMSLPCGHEFHADCITPWLVTRRRTCPICKGDVVRSLSQAHRDDRHHSPSPTRSRSPRHFHDDPDLLQVQAAETRNDSPSAARPVPQRYSSQTEYDNFEADVEANWGVEDDPLMDEVERQRTEDSHRDREFDLSSSMRELGTSIWRRWEAIRGATGFQRQESVDRDR